MQKALVQEIDSFQCFPFQLACQQKKEDGVSKKIKFIRCNFGGFFISI